MGRGKRRGGLSSFFPLPIVPRPLSFFSPASPQHKGVSAEETVTAFITENNGGAKMTQW